MSIECITHQYHSWRRDSVVGNERKNFDTYLLIQHQFPQLQRPSENWYPSFYSNAGNGKTRHDILAQDGAAFKTFFPKSSTSTSWRHLLTSTTCCSCDALHLAMSETWELGTSQINYRTLPGNLPHRSRACMNKTFLGRHIYIYIYTTIQLHKYIRKFQIL